MAAPTPPTDRRAQILRATITLIGEGGVTSISNRRVAKEAGVSLGAMTYYFDSQSQLLRQALDLFLGEETARLTQLADQVRATQLTDQQASAGLEALLSQEPGRRIAKFELYLLATRDPELRESALGCFAAYDALAQSALEASGVGNAAALAPLMVAMIDGLQLRRLVAGDAQLQLADPLTAMLRAFKAQ